MVGMGSVVTRNVPPHALVIGNPARQWAGSASADIRSCGGPSETNAPASPRKVAPSRAASASDRTYSIGRAAALVMNRAIGSASKTGSAIVGGGILGLTLGLRLAKLGHHVELFEAAPRARRTRRLARLRPVSLGPLLPLHPAAGSAPHRARSASSGSAGELRWNETGTGYYARGRWYPMSKSVGLREVPAALVDRQGARRGDGRLRDHGRRSR